MRAIESGELKIVGVNCFQETAESPLTAGGDSGIMKVDPRAESEQIAALQAFRAGRDDKRVQAALGALKQAAEDGANIMHASITCAHAGVTTGEWSQVLRDVFGEYRAPTGIDISTGDHEANEQLLKVREAVRRTGAGTFWSP